MAVPWRPDEFLETNGATGQLFARQEETGDRKSRRAKKTGWLKRGESARVPASLSANELGGRVLLVTQDAVEVESIIEHIASLSNWELYRRTEFQVRRWLVLSTDSAGDDVVTSHAHGAKIE